MLTKFSTVKKGTKKSRNYLDLENSIELVVDETSSLIEREPVTYNLLGKAELLLPFDLHSLILEYLTEADFLKWAKQPGGIEELSKYFIFDSRELITLIDSKDILEKIENEQTPIEQKHRFKTNIIFSMIALATGSGLIFALYQLISRGLVKTAIRIDAKNKSNNILEEIMDDCHNLFSSSDRFINSTLFTKIINVFFRNGDYLNRLNHHENWASWRSSHHSFEHDNGPYAQSIFNVMPTCTSKLPIFLEESIKASTLDDFGLYFLSGMVLLLGLCILVLIYECYSVKIKQDFMQTPACLLTVENHSSSQIQLAEILKTNNQLTMSGLKEILTKRTLSNEKSVLNHHGLFTLRTIPGSERRNREVGFTL